MASVQKKIESATTFWVMHLVISSFAYISHVFC